MVYARALLVPLLIVVPAAGQLEDGPHGASIAAMRESIRLQWKAVERQRKTFLKGDAATFNAGWPIGSAAAAPAEMVDTLAEEQCEVLSPSELREYIESVAGREGLAPDLLRAVIQRESAFDPCAVSIKGAQGLMQLMPPTAAQLGVRNPFNAEDNIDGGARYLGQLLLRYAGDVGLALGAYNAGPSRVDQYQGLPPIPETLNYVSDIMDALQAAPLDPPPGIAP